MKLFVIVIALLSERFFVHRYSHKRFDWFSSYCQKIILTIENKTSLHSGGLKLVVLVAPLLIGMAIILLALNSLLYGFIILILNIIIFYYCLGPDNPFYPAHHRLSQANSTVGYLADVNGQLFAVIFWYIALGPLGVIFYRVVSLAQKDAYFAEKAQELTTVLDWLPVRMTGLLYLLAGNFQSGLHYYTNFFFTKPANNQKMLRLCGFEAAGLSQAEPDNLPRAETLVEHALLILLVLLACFTLGNVII